MAGVALQVIAAHADLDAHEFVTEPARRFEMVPSRNPITAPRRMASSSSCNASNWSGEPACSTLSPRSTIGGTLASVRSTARSACLRSNCASALALSALVTILRRSQRRTVLEHRGKLGGKTGVKAVGVSDGEDQRFGIPHPSATTPNRRDGEDQCQHGKTAPFACGRY
jgi:hypothetical protein